MSYVIRSKLTKKTYDVQKTVRILNPLQCAAYMLNGAELLDMYATTHYETGMPVLVYLFDRESTSGLYEAWCNHTLY